MFRADGKRLYSRTPVTMPGKLTGDELSTKVSHIGDQSGQQPLEQSAHVANFFEGCILLGRCSQ